MQGGGEIQRDVEWKNTECSACNMDMRLKNLFPSPFLNTRVTVWAEGGPHVCLSAMYFQHSELVANIQKWRVQAKI